MALGAGNLLHRDVISVVLPPLCRSHLWCLTPVCFFLNAVSTIFASWLSKASALCRGQACDPCLDVGGMCTELMETSPCGGMGRSTLRSLPACDQCTLCFHQHTAPLCTGQCERGQLLYVHAKGKRSPLSSRNESV